MEDSLKKVKRKIDEEKYESCLSEQIKKCRITVTAGELRMQKDLNAIKDYKSIIFEFGSKSIIINFCDKYHSPCPDHFQIIIPNYYPHDKPIIKCLDMNYYNEFILQNGNVLHPNIELNWNALCTLDNIIDTIQIIRMSFVYTYKLMMLK